MQRRVSRQALVILGAVLVSGFAGVPAAQAERPQPNLDAGRAAYEQSCARCHGPQGQGDGRDAKRLYPRPRNLTEGVFKFRSTASGTAPTDDDLLHTVTHGLTPGNMPDWRHLDDTTRRHLVDYVKSLSTVFEGDAPEPLAIGRDPGVGRADARKGRAVYETLGCAACHGATGRAEGASAPTLVDNGGQPIRPANLTHGWTYRGGSDPTAIVTRLMTGIDGTPMPSYAEAVSPEDAWSLAYYLRSIQREPRWAAIVRAAQVAGDAPTTIDDARWQQAETVNVPLRTVPNAAGEINRPQTIDSAQVQAIAASDAVSFRIVWDDPTDDHEAQPDRLALTLRPAGMAGDVISLHAWPLKDSPPLDIALWSADAGRAVEAVARDFAAVTARAVPSQPLAGEAAYRDGQWTAVIVRPLTMPSLGAAAQMSARRLAPIGLSIWDGGNEQQQAVSMWVEVDARGTLVDHEAAPHSKRSSGASGWVWVVSGVALVIGCGLAFKRNS